MPGVLVDSSSHPPLPFESFLDLSASSSPFPDLPSPSPQFHTPRILPRSKLGFSPASSESPPSDSAFVDAPPAMASPRDWGPGARDVLAALQRFLPSNRDGEEVCGSVIGSGAVGAMDAYTCDEFRMYEFKVRRCMRGRSHDWTECPFAHPGEKARRRDPRRFHYSGAACPDFRKGTCKKGDACEFAHGVFECWLHPARYRTQPCKDGRGCRRRVCFFAHSVEQLRILPAASSFSDSPPSNNRSPFSCDSSSGGGNNSSSSSGNSNGNGNNRSLLLSSDASWLHPVDPSSVDDYPPPPSRLILQKLIDHGYGVASSPTSPLLCPLSPPLSPSSSPPLSPDAASFCRSRSFSAQSHCQSPLSIPAHRRHLNRLHSIPTIAIPPSSTELAAESYDETALFSMSPGSNGGDLSGLLQALQLRSRIGDLQRGKAVSAPASPEAQQWRQQQQGSVSVRQAALSAAALPPTPMAEAWTGDYSNLGRVESGSALRANFYGKIGKENGVGGFAESPDLEWVRNLVD